MKDTPRLCFIGGSGRSGTTVLRRIFDLHPDVASIPEFRITLDPDGLLDFYITMREQWSPYLFDKKFKSLTGLLSDARRGSSLNKYYRFITKKTGLMNTGRRFERKYAGIGIAKHAPHYDRLVRQLKEELSSFCYHGSWTGQHIGEKTEVFFRKPFDADELSKIIGDFYRKLAGDICADQEGTHFAEDNTWNILYFKDILELLPEAKLVHIYRDPRDVVASFTHQSWSPSDPVQASHFYSGLMEQWHKVRSRIPEESYLEISLEELVSNPREVLDEIVDFWSLSWNESLLELDLSKSHTGRWKKDIPAHLQDEVNALLNTYIDRYG